MISYQSVSGWNSFMYIILYWLITVGRNVLAPTLFTFFCSDENMWFCSDLLLKNMHFSKRCIIAPTPYFRITVLRQVFYPIFIQYLQEKKFLTLPSLLQHFQKFLFMVYIIIQGLLEFSSPWIILMLIRNHWNITI